MLVLIAAATEGEIQPLKAYLSANWTPATHLVFRKNNLTIKLCYTGIGGIAATYQLAKALSEERTYFALQAGIGGSFDPDLPLGSLYFIDREQNGDLGIENRETFEDLFDTGLLQPDEIPFQQKLLPAPPHPLHASIDLPHKSGLTVSTVSGHAPTIAARSVKYKADIESMEGAAFHYVCLQEKVPFAQIRAISNYVQPRDRSSWKMKEAVTNLNQWLIGFIEQMEELSCQI